MFSFKLKNMCINVHISFLFLMIFIQKLFYSDMLIYFASSCFIHEMGHLFSFVLVGEKISRIDVNMAGILIQPKNRLCSFSKEILILFFGPLFNLFFGILCFKINSELSALFLITGMFHLMPFKMLDGGRIFYSYLSKKMKDQGKAEKICDTVDLTISGALLVALVVFDIGNLCLYIFVFFNVLKDLKTKILDNIQIV